MNKISSRSHEKYSFTRKNPELTAILTKITIVRSNIAPMEKTKAGASFVKRYIHTYIEGP